MIDLLIDQKKTSAGSYKCAASIKLVVIGCLASTNPDDVTSSETNHRAANLTTVDISAKDGVEIPQNETLAVFIVFYYCMLGINCWALY